MEVDRGILARKMIASSRARPEEERAAALLCDLIKARGDAILTWEPGADPPDLVFTVGSERWAVEITRSDQRVPAAEGTRSRGDADTKLISFGQSLARQLQSSVTRPYTLVLRPRAGVTDTKSWKKAVRRAAEAVIAHGRGGRFKLDVMRCAELEASESTDAENRIFVICDAYRARTPEGHATYDIFSNLSESIRYALREKAATLGGLSGFDRIVLVLDNMYWLASVDDACEIATSEAPNFPIFDMIFMIHRDAIHEIYPGR